jgi:ABC-type multidrug transport system permease subunit
MNRNVTEVARYFFPPLVRVQSAKEEEEEEGPTGIALVAAYVLPGISVLALLMIAQISMRDILREETTGTLRRVLSSPATVNEVILGRIVSTAVVALACLLILVGVGAMLKAPAPPAVPFALLSLAFVTGVCGFVALVYGLARNERQGTTFGEIVVMGMAFAGGSWVPLDSLPAGVRAVSPFTLNFWAVEGYRKLLFEDGGWNDARMSILVLFAVGIVTATLGAAFLRRRLLRGVA